MGRFVVLLCGVDVGKGNKVPMAEFRAVLEELGHTGVHTLLAGGLLESKAGEAILGKGGRSITTRNWGTTLKLASLLSGSAA